MARESLPAVIEQATGREAIPALIADAGGAACFAWEEFFSGEIRDLHTRRAYRHAVRRFLAWVEGQGISLRRITPGLVGRYFDQHPASIPTRTQHLAALRSFFDRLVVRHVLFLNPAASVRGSGIRSSRARRRKSPPPRR